jgi:Methane oxygenase PmoA
MKSRAIQFGICAVVLLHMAAAMHAQVHIEHQQKIKLRQHAGTIDIEVNGKPFSTYHFADHFLYPTVRPYFWPVLASNGVEVTIDQAQHKELRPYQRSIWIGAGDVNGADHWKFKAVPLPKQRHIRFLWVHHNGFEEKLIWEDKAAQPMLEEIRTVVFHAGLDGVRGIEINVKLKPVAGDVTFANTSDNGLLSIRPIPSIASRPEFTADDDGPDCNKHSAWCDESGEIDGHTYGIAMFDAPANPRHPPLWHAHADARLATDIFATPQYGKGDPRRNAGDFTIRTGATATFRYEILIHKGTARDAHVSEKYLEFASPHK